MSLYPYKPDFGQRIQDVSGLPLDRSFIAHQTWGTPAALAGSAVLSGTALGTAAITVTTLTLATLDYPRNLTVIGVGTATAGTVAITGTNILDATISENIVLNGTVTVAGSAAFKTITQAVLPAQVAAVGTARIGYGDKLGLKATLAHNTVIAASLNNVREATAPTVAVNATSIHYNTVLLSSALDGTDVDVYYLL